MKLDRKVAIVTGGSDGIGLATARALARAGCAVAICAREPARLERAAEAIRAEGGRVLALPGDVADPDFAGRLVGATVDTFGGVDILVNNAAIGLQAPVQHIREGDLARVIAADVLGPLRLMQAVLPAMRGQRSGAIVNVASIIVGRPTPRMGGYTAAKGALVGLSKTLRLEVLRDGVTVINVYPGLTRTGFGGRSIRPPSTGRRRNLNRFGVSPERVARAIVSAIRRGRTEVVVTKRDRLLLALNALAPWLFDRLIAFVR